jgi:peptidyl-prolyl cis-trans isomerase B (cyclophilin B)
VAGKKERQRRLERERLERRNATRAQQQERARRWTAISLAIVVVIGLAVGGYFVFRGGGKPAQAAASPSASATVSASTPSASASSTPSASPSPSPSGSLSASASAPAVAAGTAKGTCAYTASPPVSRNVGRPPAKPDKKATYVATIHTNRGSIVINLRNSAAPCTVNSFVYLAVKKYFSQTNCHRLTTSGIFVLQCGDPTGTGSGGPGYKFNDENLAGAKYPAGTVAMANAGPNTNGSQFFLVYKNTTGLQPNYTPFGTIVSGLKIVQNVAKAGSDNANGPGDGHPKEKVVISSVTIKKT